MDQKCRIFNCLIPIWWQSTFIHGIISGYTSAQLFVVSLDSGKLLFPYKLAVLRM